VRVQHMAAWRYIYWYSKNQIYKKGEQSERTKHVSLKKYPLVF